MTRRKLNSTLAVRGPVSIEEITNGILIREIKVSMILPQLFNSEVEHDWTVFVG